MSEVVRHIGKVRKVDLKGLSIEEWCKAKCIELGIEKHQYNSYEETLQEACKVCKSKWRYLGNSGGQRRRRL